MTIRHYHDFHVAVNSGMLKGYLIVQKGGSNLYSITGQANGLPVYETDDYKSLRAIMLRRYGVRMPKLSELPFIFRLSNIFGYTIKTALMYDEHDCGTFSVVTVNELED